LTSTRYFASNPKQAFVPKIYMFPIPPYTIYE
jgi:hypothetical protein